MGVDESGNAIVVWLPLGAGSGPSAEPHAVYANRFSVANGEWGAPEEIKFTAGSSENPLAAVSASGNAVAVWQVRFADELEVSQFR